MTWCAGLRAAADPVDLTANEGQAALIVGFGIGLAFGFLAQKVLVIAVMRIEPTAG